MKESPSRQDTTYVLIVGALAVVIVAALAVLWLNERRMRLASESRLHRMVERESLQSAIAEMLQRSEPIRRDDLTRGTVSFEGRPRTVLYLDSAESERLGFRGGDIIVVRDGKAASQRGK